MEGFKELQLFILSKHRTSIHIMHEKYGNLLPEFIFFVNVGRWDEMKSENVNLNLSKVQAVTGSM